MHVCLEDVQDLRKEFLLMQVIELQGGVHSVNNSVLVDESRKLTDDCSDQTS